MDVEDAFRKLHVVRKFSDEPVTGSAPATVYGHGLCREILGYPQDRNCEYLLNFGHPAAPDTLTRPLRRGGRLALEEIVFGERWVAPYASNHGSA